MLLTGRARVRYIKMFGSSLFHMVLLPPELEFLLPPLGSQENVVDPIVYAKFYVPDYAWSYHPMEGSRQGNEYTFYGFMLGSADDADWKFSHLKLSTLERILEGRVIRDEQFVPGALTDTVRLPLDY